MVYQERIALYLQFYYERGIEYKELLHDVPYKDLVKKTRANFYKQAVMQAHSRLVPQRIFDPILDEFRWDLKEYGYRERG